MTSSRSRDASGSFASRRGHGSQLSISDPSHHVTDAISTLYGDEDEDVVQQSTQHLHPNSEQLRRPLSYMPGVGSPFQDQIHRAPLRPESQRDDPRRHLLRANSEQAQQPQQVQNRDHRAQTVPIRPVNQLGGSQDQGSAKSPISPAPSLRDVQADQFPLTNIENPTDIAQELSNLQALKRMSMDVGNSIDPDMPHMSFSSIPAIAPSGDDDENDPSRLLWVPAKVHPELAPAEFKSFLEKRVNSIKRRSGESMLSVDGLSRSDSGLSRKKSTLSTQIDRTTAKEGENYEDGAERLERQHSRSRGHKPELSLDELVKDPTGAVQKLTHESTKTAEGGGSEDKPILPMAPGGGLRRSTNTTYRKGGSLRSGDRAPFSRRAAQRQQEGGNSEYGRASLEAPPGHGLTRVQSDPVAENYSRPTRPTRQPLSRFTQDGSALSSEDDAGKGPTPPPQVRQDEISLGPSRTQPTIEKAPVDESGASSRSHGNQQTQQYPSSRSPLQSTPQQVERRHHETAVEPPSHSNMRQQPSAVPSQVHTQQQQLQQPTHAQPAPRQTQYSPRTGQNQQGQSLNESLAAHSSVLPGGNASTTDSLTFIPTLTVDDRKGDRKSRKDDDSGSSSSRAGSAWKWFKGDKDEKKKDDGKKSKKGSVSEKAQDNTRLDVIQTSIDRSATKGRESLVLERESFEYKLQDERKKDGNRRSDSKREKDGIFSSIFGSKRKEDKERAVSRKAHHLQVPEEPAYVPLQPDVDYHWTRFPLLEERAIYRMAHIKLANPRRPLLSQVLLSNFMYSYLAIVQAMHPQMNVPTSPQQKRLEEEARRKQQEEQYRQEMGGEDGQGLDQYDFDYHRAAVQYADQGNNSGQVEYVDDSQIYQDEHWDEQQDEYGYDNGDSYGHDVKDYYQYNHHHHNNNNNNNNNNDNNNNNNHNNNNSSDRHHGGRQDNMW